MFEAEEDELFNHFQIDLLSKSKKEGLICLNKCNFIHFFTKSFYLMYLKGLLVRVVQKRISCFKICLFCICICSFFVYFCKFL